MKRPRRITRNANNLLEQAMTELAHAQASLVRNQALFLEYIPKIEERFRRIESILLRHERILEGLPEAVRRTIGFKARKAT